MTPNPNPIPPELPTDPSRVPPPEMPINTPPEKGPGTPQPIPPSPIPPTRVVRPLAALIGAALLVTSESALAQRTIGRDTTELTPGNPMQTECSRISDAEERARCYERHRQSGAPETANPRGGEARPTHPSVPREQVDERDRDRPQPDPDKPAATAR